MEAYQLFQRLSPELADAIFSYFRTEERVAYQGIVEQLAGQQKMRPVFITKQAPAKQTTLLTAGCARKPANAIATHVLEIWLVRQRVELLTNFMDGMDIPHDGVGVADELPDEMDAQELATTLTALLERYPEPEIALYLHILQNQKEGGWPELAEALGKLEF